jgi:hypothetical protein
MQRPCLHLHAVRTCGDSTGISHRDRRRSLTPKTRPTPPMVTSTGQALCAPSQRSRSDIVSPRPLRRASPQIDDGPPWKGGENGREGALRTRRVALKQQSQPAFGLPGIAHLHPHDDREGARRQAPHTGTHHQRRARRARGIDESLGGRPDRQGIPRPRPALKDPPRARAALRSRRAPPSSGYARRDAARRTRSHFPPGVRPQGEGGQARPRGPHRHARHADGCDVSRSPFRKEGDVDRVDPHGLRRSRCRRIGGQHGDANAGDLPRVDTAATLGQLLAVAPEVPEGTSAITRAQEEGAGDRLGCAEVVAGDPVPEAELPASIAAPIEGVPRGRVTRRGAPTGMVSATPEMATRRAGPAADPADRQGTKTLSELTIGAPRQPVVDSGPYHQSESPTRGAFPHSASGVPSWSGANVAAATPSSQAIPVTTSARS